MSTNPCSCDFTEREAQNKADWDDPPKPGSFDVIGAKQRRLWPPVPVWHRPTCDALDDYPLVPINEGSCPKCGSTDLRSAFHEARWDYTPHHHDYWRTDLYTYRCALTQRYHPVEHIDQRCGRCAFAWLAAAVAEVPA